jgi:hypothetical protein
MDARLEQQVRVSKRLGVGFACSLLGVGGIASLVALIIGLRARREINQSGGEIVGLRMAWWCIITGAIGTLVFPPLVALLVIRQLR